jgi:hypothetical protein
MSGSKRSARAAAVLGALAVLVIPAGIAASRVLGGVTLLRSLYGAVPAACLLGLLAVAFGRRARLTAARTVRPDVAGSARLGRSLAWTGLYVGFTGALALAVYGVLRWAQ